MWGHRVIIPPQGRQQLLDEFYVAHLGIERIKSLAHSYLWWQSLIHVYYAGPLQGKMFLVIVDSYSKWLDVCVTSSASSVITIDKLQTTFTDLGLQEMIVSDNGTCFNSQEFQIFGKQNGIQHVRTTAYRPIKWPC